MEMICPRYWKLSHNPRPTKARALAAKANSMDKKNKPTQLQISPWHVAQAIKKAPKAASDRHGGNASAAIRFIIENYQECSAPKKSN